MTTQKMDIAAIRTDYTLRGLTEEELTSDPITQFLSWFQEAMDQQVNEPNAMTLATVSASGRPSARIVLLKDVNESGFSFYTNYLSRKGTELSENPQASLLFFWPELQRQVRIEGTVTQLSKTVSETYFQSRPKGNRIGAWASPQSQEIKNREELDTRIQALEKEYEGQDYIPKPDYWGGYLLQPDVVEFWQGRGSRVHDRLCYKKENDNWRIVRLAP